MFYLPLNTNYCFDFKYAVQKSQHVYEYVYTTGQSLCEHEWHQWYRYLSWVLLQVAMTLKYPLNAVVYVAFSTSTVCNCTLQHSYLGGVLMYRWLQKALAFLPWPDSCLNVLLCVKTKRQNRPWRLKAFSSWMCCKQYCIWLLYFCWSVWTMLILVYCCLCLATEEEWKWEAVLKELLPCKTFRNEKQIWSCASLWVKHRRKTQIHFGKIQ